MILHMMSADSSISGMLIDLNKWYVMSTLAKFSYEIEKSLMSNQLVHFIPMLIVTLLIGAVGRTTLVEGRNGEYLVLANISVNPSGESPRPCNLKLN
jgi:hypothetical protein